MVSMRNLQEVYMELYIWLFPILFIFHDIEEIGFETWLKKNKTMLGERFPFVIKCYDHYSTEGIAFAVMEEFILCLIICIIASITNNKYVYLLWLGSFIAYSLHLIVHLIQFFVIRNYIPAVITSIICLPISIWCIEKCLNIINCELHTTILFCMIGILIVIFNLKFAQSLIGKFTKWIE